MTIIKDIWNLLVMVAFIAYFGGLAALTVKLGQSALDLQQKGMFSLSKYNRMLVGK